jgi:hypothetical protein
MPLFVSFVTKSVPKFQPLASNLSLCIRDAQNIDTLAPFVYKVFDFSNFYSDLQTAELKF